MNMLKGEVAAELKPSMRARSRCQPGGLQGKIYMLPDFDTWPDDVLAIMESDNG